MTSLSAGLDGQEWYINYDASIVNPFFNLTLDVKGALTAAGSGLIGYTKNNQKNQQFKFICL